MTADNADRAWTDYSGPVDSVDTEAEQWAAATRDALAAALPAPGLRAAVELAAHIEEMVDRLAATHGLSRDIVAEHLTSAWRAGLLTWGESIARFEATLNAATIHLDEHLKAHTITADTVAYMNAEARRQALPVRLGRAERRACGRRPGGHGPTKAIDDTPTCTACGSALPTEKP